MNSAPWEMKGAYPSRAALVSLLTVFVLLSALFFPPSSSSAACSQTSRGGAVNFPDRFAAREKKETGLEVLERLHGAASPAMPRWGVCLLLVTEPCGTLPGGSPGLTGEQVPVRYSVCWGFCHQPPASRRGRKAKRRGGGRMSDPFNSSGVLLSFSMGLLLHLWLI